MKAFRSGVLEPTKGGVKVELVLTMKKEVLELEKRRYEEKLMKLLSNLH